MTLLNQIVAVEAGVRSTAEKDLTQDYHDAQKNDAAFTGITRTYEPRFETGARLPDERTEVQVVVQDIVDRHVKTYTRLLDVTATKDVGNTRALVDVTVDGETLLTQVPVPFLIFLEKELQKIRTFISKLPLLDPAKTWNLDPNSKPGVYVTPPRENAKTQREPRAFTLVQATDKHPAQVQAYQEDVVVGYWTVRDFSGRIPAERQSELLEKVDRLRDAVKMAREEANSTEVENINVGAGLMRYLFA